MKIVNLDQAVDLILNAGLVAFPTETVYGLGADATNVQAINKVFIAKNRPADNPLICHFHSLNQILDYGIEVSPITRLIFEKLTPGPCSLLLDLPLDSELKYATAGQKSVICRIPNHPVALELIKKLNKPIVGPSANTSGRPSATSAKMVLDDLGDKIDGVLDGLNSSIGVESTILDLRDKKIKILRPGVIGLNELTSLFHKNVIEYEITENIKEQVTPGTKYTHYSPKTRVYKITNSSEITAKKDFIVLASYENILKFNLKSDLNKNIIIQTLGSKNNLNNIARDLYFNLASVDNFGIKEAYLVEDNWGDSSLAKAISNRLSKVGVIKQ